MDTATKALLSLSRKRLVESDFASVQHDAPGIDWRQYADLAIRGGIPGLALRHLDRVPDCPESIKHSLVAASLSCEARNRILFAELERLEERMAEVGAPLVPLKGAAFLTRGIYSSLGDRFLTDLDLLTTRDALAQVSRALEDCGYDRADGDHDDEHLTHHRRFYRKIGELKVLVEIHWSTLFAIYRDPKEDEALWSRIVEYPGSCGVRRELSLEDLLLVAFLHLAVHRYRLSLKWLVDIRELLEFADRSPDWGSIYQRAERINALRAVARSVLFARDLCQIDIPLPGTIPTLLRVLAALTGDRPLLASKGNANWLQRGAIDLLLRDSFFDSLRHLRRKIIDLRRRLTA